MIATTLRSGNLYTFRQARNMHLIITESLHDSNILYISMRAINICICKYIWWMDTAQGQPTFSAAYPHDGLKANLPGEVALQIFLELVPLGWIVHVVECGVVEDAARRVLGNTRYREREEKKESRGYYCANLFSSMFTSLLSSQNLLSSQCHFYNY